MLVRALLSYLGLSVINGLLFAICRLLVDTLIGWLVSRLVDQLICKSATPKNERKQSFALEIK